MPDIEIKEKDKQIFVTALNKLDNPRCKELIHEYILSGKFLQNQEDAKKWNNYLKSINISENPISAERSNKYEVTIISLESQNQQYKKAIDEIETLLDNGYFNEPIYDSNNNFDQNNKWVPETP